MGECGIMLVARTRVKWNFFPHYKIVFILPYPLHSVITKAATRHSPPSTTSTSTQSCTSNLNMWRVKWKGAARCSRPKSSWRSTRGSTLKISKSSKRWDMLYICDAAHHKSGARWERDFAGEVNY